MFIKNPCGIVYIIVTYAAVFYADYAVVRWVILYSLQDSLWGPFHVVAFNTVVLLLIMSHLKAVCSDPGVVPLPQSRMDFSDIHTDNPETKIECDERDNWTVCTRCETYRPPKAHHCRICKRCVRRMDHHCPWINNCVGESNQKYFIQFLVYVGMLAVYALGLVITSWVLDCSLCSNDKAVKQTRTFHCVVLVLESALFGMFVIAVLVEQFLGILSEENPMEHVQSNHHYKRNSSRTFVLLSQVCGKSHPILWMLPCQNPPKYTFRKDAYLIDHEV
ncbi:PREDICTED: palmitoyltransferase ZDHHC3 [Dufourea novaeangliae]|uniref:palmitoyltransferase ZDHHC3 n=1 Tax=Dufourea novaeangliae TaxID=178035 RepID=UPI0007676652|nr:PREDICTED: palmitoyltransferase ZDHHC3 [Dufourea novaeangliae]KZC15111.1 Palmitoyltransferase ZDHHC3 [Dufourea novaeangliae]